MKAKTLSKKLAKYVNDEVYVLLEDGTAIPVRLDGVRAIKAHPKEDGGKTTLVRSKRANRRVVIAVRAVSSKGAEDTAVVPEGNRPGIDL
jgi:hypothetical protein